MILYQPMQIIDGKFSQTPMWHQKAIKDGFLYISGYDPQEVIDVGYVVTNDAGLDENGNYVGKQYQVVKVLERRDHKGMPAGNNGYYKVKCEVIDGDN